jgi:outer membrane protein assembly factor BamB/TolA-binding protein
MAAILGIGLALLGAGSAQDDEEDTRNTCLVQNYAELDVIVKKTAALEAARRWEEALALYEEAVENRPNTVIPFGHARAVGVREFVFGRLAAWPEEGRAVVRRRMDPAAERLFAAGKAARDVEALERLAGQYPYSSFVDDALSLVGTLRLDAGDPSRAAEAFERLLDMDGDVPRPVTAARLGIALSQSGQKARLEALEGRAAREWPDAVVSVGGREESLAARLAGLARATAPAGPAALPLRVPAWEMIGGAPSGSRLAEPGVALARAAWRALIGPPRYDTDDFTPYSHTFLRPGPDFRPLFPAAWDGIVYVHNGSALSAFSLFADEPDLLWNFAPEARAGEVMFDDRQICAVTVDDGRAYANLITEVGEASDQRYVRVKYPFPKRALFALDAHSGRVLWRLGGRKEGSGLAEIATFSAPPVPEGDRLYVGAVEQLHPTDPFKHHVLCLEAATGRIVWSTYIAMGGTEINLFGNSTRESFGSPVAVSGESVFYATNHGALAAVEKRTGRLRWTYRYRQHAVNPTRSPQVYKNPLGWVNSPPVVAHGIVAAAPTDSPILYGLDVRTGERRWEVGRTEDDRTLYGVREATLVVGGAGLRFLDLPTGRLVRSIPRTLGGAGRGVVAEDGVYVPCRDGLRRVGWDGTWDESRTAPWAGSSGGNLIVVDGAIVLATQDAVQAFFDRRAQDRAIRAALEAAPGDLALAYRAALRLVAAGDDEEAARLLGRVAERTAASASAEDARLHRAARQRLYALSMNGGRAAIREGKHDRAAALFARARAAAPDVPAEVEAALEAARLHAERNDPARAVDEFQALIAGRGDAVVGGRPVLDVAREALGGVLRASGRGPYARHEAEARRMLAEARRRGTVEAFGGVFRAYPNSFAAEEALLEEASAHARLGRADEEVAALRRFLREMPASERSPEAHALLARALERRGYFSSAGAVLRRLARAFPDARISDGEGTVAAREFAERRLKSEPYARSSGPAGGSALAPPLRKVLEHTDPDHPEGAPVAVAGTPPAKAGALLVVGYGADLKAFDDARAAEAWSLSLPSPVRHAGWSNGALLLANDGGVRRVEPSGGRVEWHRAVRGAVHGFAAAEGMVGVLSTGPNEIVALDAARGGVAWSRPFEGFPAGGLHAAGDQLVFATGSPSALHVIDLETGAKVGGNALAAGFPPRVVSVSDSLAVLVTEGMYLDAFEVPGGKLLWRVDLQGFGSPVEVQVGSAGAVLLGNRWSANPGGEESAIARVDLRTGKLAAMKGLAVRAPVLLKLDGERAYVVSREADRSVALRGVRLADLEVEWKTDLGAREATLLPPMIAKDHVVVAGFERDAGGLYGYLGKVVDKRGSIVQNIGSRPAFERPPVASLVHGRIVFSVDNRVEVWR